MKISSDEMDWMTKSMQIQRPKLVLETEAGSGVYSTMAIVKGLGDAILHTCENDPYQYMVLYETFMDNDHITSYQCKGSELVDAFRDKHKTPDMIIFGDTGYPQWKQLDNYLLFGACVITKDKELIDALQKHVAWRIDSTINDWIRAVRI